MYCAGCQINEWSCMQLIIHVSAVRCITANSLKFKRDDVRISVLDCTCSVAVRLLFLLKYSSTSMKDHGKFRSLSLQSPLSSVSPLLLPAFFVERTVADAADVLFSLSGCQQFECERALGGRESRSWLEGPEMGSRVASNPSPFSAWTRMASVNTLATAMTAAAGHAATPCWSC